MKKKPTNFIRSGLRSQNKIRSLTAAALGLIPTDVPIASEQPLRDYIRDDDPLLLETRRLLADGYAGVIFTGPPGTSKSYLCEGIAAKLADLDPTRVRFIQFHPSYQYEDFVEGLVPQAGGGFRFVDKHLLDMCDVARQSSGKPCFIVIDELSRADPGRVFGEALTYIELDKRNRRFRLSSGKEDWIPPNLFFLATMNPMDRGVDEVDAALERRFAKIAMDPDVGRLRKILTDNGVEQDIQNRIVSFFEYLLNNRAHPYLQLGHAYFRTVKDEYSLRRLWQNQLRFYFQKALRLEEQAFLDVENAWISRVFPAAPAESPDRAGTEEVPSANLR